MAEPITSLLMLACFGMPAAWARWPVGLALLVAAWAGARVHSHGWPLRHLVEGAFSYLDPILVIATALLRERSLGRQITGGVVLLLLLLRIFLIIK
jgi:hypothetical protein